MVKAVLLEYKPAAVQEGHIAFHNLLWALQSDRAQLWLWLPDYPEGETIGGWLLTSVQVNVFGVKELVIHFLYTYITATPGDGVEVLDKLSIFGKSVGCDRVVGYTKSQQFSELMAENSEMKIVGYIVGRDLNGI